MVKLYILCGYPFSGKSTLAKELIKKYGFVRIALSDINEERGVSKESYKGITPEEWRETYNIYHDRIAKNLKDRYSVIVDTVGHTRTGREGLRKIAKENNAKSVVLYLTTPLYMVKERWMKNRQTNERVDVTDKNFNDVVNEFEIPGNDEGVISVSNEMTTEEIYKLVEAK